ncbi:MAG: L-threonylcarbamoyladenylate synthase [Bacteroidia bacterium]
MGFSLAMIGTDLTYAQALLMRNEVVAIPTETVYGLAANALSEKAVAKIYALKKRPTFNPLILHIGRKEALYRYASQVPWWAEKLAETFWPGPLTFLLPKSEKIPLWVTAGSKQVALRMPAHPLTLELLRNLPFPLAAPSANFSGRLSPTKPEHVQEAFGDQVPYILDGGPCEAGLESTIIGEKEGKLGVYRLGSLPLEKMEPLVGPLAVWITPTEHPVAPGLLKKHYAPQIPLLYGWETVPYEPEMGMLFFNTNPYPHAPYAYVLSQENCSAQAAARFFELLHHMENLSIQGILVKKIPVRDSLTWALHERLQRAQSPGVFTLGHSHHSWETFVGILRRYQVTKVIDTRKRPFSRYVPHFDSPAMACALTAMGITYENLPYEIHQAQAYLSHIDENHRTVLLCAEKDPQKCHRWDLATQLENMGIPVYHILFPPRLQRHPTKTLFTNLS